MLRLLLSSALGAVTLCAVGLASKAQPPATAPAATAPAATPPAAPPASQPDKGFKTVAPFPGVSVFINESDPDQSRVEVQAFTCLDAGWLEQVACMPGTREHESLMVVNAKPSHVHAALLMAGFEPGKPGRWTYENQKFGAIDPTGEKLAILVRYADEADKTVEHDVGKWIRGPATKDTEGRPFPKEPWVFGGSLIAPNKEGMGEGEHYVADMTGSVIGLVTFGDETIGFSRVLSDQESVQEPVWEANTETMPEMATPVTIIIRKWPE